MDGLNNSGISLSQPSNGEFNINGAYTENVKKKKSSKASKLTLAVLTVALFCCIFWVNEQREKQIAQWQTNQWIVFSDDLDSTENVKTITAKQIEEYKPETEIYSSEYFYNKLSHNEKIAYKAYLYAIDNNYVYTYIDGSLLTEGNSALDILVFLSLDTGFVQQNLEAKEYECTQTITSNIIFKRVEKKVSGSLVSVENFTRERIENVEKAVSQLKNVDLGFKKDMTQREKAKLIYEYVGEKLDYAKKYDNDKEPPEGVDFLYEAVFDGDTNCDGFSNVFSMMCALNGIECIEKSTNAKKGELGHTWCVASLDGEWYNIDCTESTDAKTNNDKVYRSLYFGFSDEMQSYSVKYRKMLPECSRSINPIKKVYSKYSYEVALFASEELKKNPDKAVFVLMKNASDSDVKRLAQNTVNRLHGSIAYVRYNALGGTVVKLSVDK